MKNIFENAYFGKSYKTREGKRAILIGFSPLVVALDDINNKGGYPYRVFEDGRINDDRYPTFETKFDLVSEWQEEIRGENSINLQKSAIHIHPMINQIYVSLMPMMGSMKGLKLVLVKH